MIYKTDREYVEFVHLSFGSGQGLVPFVKTQINLRVPNTRGVFNLLRDFEFLDRDSTAKFVW
jgi:hypothetical protein